MLESLGLSRRSLLCAGVAAASARVLAPRVECLAAQPRPRSAGSPWRGLKLGVATYTLRKLNLESAIKAIQRVGLQYASIKDFHLPLDSTAEQRRQVIQKFRAAGIVPLSCGVISMPDEQAARHAFQYARDAGIPTIVCSPRPEALPAIERLTREFDIRIAIHNHGPEGQFFNSPDDIWPAVEKLDVRMGLCIDCAHTARIRRDPVEAILKYRDRLYDLHIRDIERFDASAHCIEGGRGVLDLGAILQALVKIGYRHLVGIEYEKDPDDPVPGLAETVGYLRGLLEALPETASAPAPQQP